MQIHKLAVDGFRNLATGTWSPGPGVNIFCGDNAQGKTNLLEACWLFTGGKSFRGAKDRDLVAFGRDTATLTLDFEAEKRRQTATLSITGRRRLTLNDLPQRSPGALVGRFCAMVFCPAHMQMLSAGAEERRRFIDAAYCQLRPGYVKVLAAYNRTLSQRNALLKSIRSGEAFPFAASDRDKRALLDIWDTHLASAAAKVTLARDRYVQRLTPPAQHVYAGISGGKETLSLQFLSPVKETAKEIDPLVAAYAARIREARDADIAAGFSTVGAHREDLLLAIDGKPIREYGSQGQRRSAVLALKLSEASLLREVIGEQPVALLDDVMSELDVSRQDYVLNHIHDWQVFITCCDPVAIERTTGGQVFHIQNGSIGG